VHEDGPLPRLASRVRVDALIRRVELAERIARNAPQDGVIARAEAAIAQANAQIGEAQANLVAADNNFERTQTLRNSGNVSNETFDLRSAAARAARSRLNSANQALAIATADLALA
jgi:HlyD family secretion protein